MTERDPRDLDAGRLLALFRELSDELALRQKQAQLFVVGGAAMALAYDQSRQTYDVDAAFEPKPIIRELAELIAHRHQLDPDWINDAAKGFLPGQDAEARTMFESEALLVQVASPEYLLAMKLQSARAERDLADAVRLYRLVGYTSADEAMSLLERSYPARLLQARHQYTVEQVAAAAAADAEENDTSRTVSES